MDLEVLPLGSPPCLTNPPHSPTSAPPPHPTPTAKLKNSRMGPEVCSLAPAKRQLKAAPASTPEGFVRGTESAGITRHFRSFLGAWEQIPPREVHLALFRKPEPPLHGLPDAPAELSTWAQHGSAPKRHRVPATTPSSTCSSRQPGLSAHKPQPLLHGAQGHCRELDRCVGGPPG